MKPEDVMEEIVKKSDSIEQLAEYLRTEAPHKDNCFHCVQRFEGNCPNFKQSNTDVETLFALSNDNVKVIACYCATGCGSFKGGLT